MKNDFKTPGIVVVPGGTGAIGKEIVEMFLQHGAFVIVPSRSKKQVDLDALPGFKERLHVIHCDYYNSIEASALVEKVEEEIGVIDTLVYCAGSFHKHKTAFAYSEEEVLTSYNANVLGFLNFYREVAQKMRDRKEGNIIVFGSVSAPYKRPFASLLDASKTSLEAWVKIIANEMSPFGVRVNMLSLSIVDTPSERLEFPKDDFLSWLQPSNVMEAVELLCYDSRMRFVNGTTIFLYNPSLMYLEERRANLRKRGVKIFEQVEKVISYA